MTITEACERTLSPYTCIKCPIKMCVIVFQIDMVLLILELRLMDEGGSGCVYR